MQVLYGLNDILLDTKNYIWGTGQHALTVMSSYISMGFPFEGFVSMNTAEDGMYIYDKPVISLSKAAEYGVNVLITEEKWHRIYELVYHFVSADHIFVNMSNQILTDIPCVACNHPFTFSGRAVFREFLRARMFGGKDKDTAIQFCPSCGMYFSSYRPNNEEMGLLYSGYRDEEYQKQRQKYDHYYTPEFNRELYDPADKGALRKKGIIDFIKDVIDIEACKQVLDFGGDKGQFIPDDFITADRYVYEISGTDTVDGVKMIVDKNVLEKYDWDLILCNQVMEHLSDVQDYFSDLVSFMNEKTYLYVEVPNERLFENSDLIWIHEHINMFSERAFWKLSTQNGVRIVKSVTEDDIIRILIHR